MLKSPKILITGGCGFIFSHVTEYFVKKEWNVSVIDNLSLGSHPEIINDSFEFINMDVSDPKVVETILDISPDYILHSAAYSDVDGSIKTPGDIIFRNTLGNLYIFEAARQLKNLVKLNYVNTDEIFGECEYRKKEDEILFPRNPYSASKATGALFRYAYDASYPSLKDKTTETRFCNIFGPRQDSRKIIPRVIQALKTGDPVPIHNDGIGKREYLHVSNIPPLMETVLLNGNRSYNISNNDLYSVNEIIEIIEKIVGRKVPVTVGERPGMDAIYQLNSSRARKELKWKPITLFEEGLIELLKLENIL
jgi:dTDP-D-glucose 4,6-dehydratase